MYTADELEIRCALAGSPRADELIACLEGEIAKRDARIVELENELSDIDFARRVSLQNESDLSDTLNQLRAELAALKAQYQRDVYGLNNEGDPIGGDPAGGYANDNARLRTELDAIKAQEPVAWVGTIEAGVPLLVVEPQNWKATPLYAAPVSEAEAQGVVMPGRDARTAYEAFYTEKTKTLPLPLGNAPVRYHNGSGQYVNDFALFGWMAWGAALDEVARLNASPVQQDQAFCEYCGGNDEEPQDHCMDCTRPAQQVSVPDGYALVPIEPTPEMIKAALDKPCFDPLGDPLPWSHITRTSYAAMLAAAPAAPAADGWIPVSERLPDIGSTVIAYYLNSYGKGRTIRAQHVEAWTIEAEDVADVDTDCVEYSEQDDCYYLLQGWYECIDNWDEYYRVAVTGGPITHWMPLPAAPSANSAQGVV